MQPEPTTALRVDLVGDDGEPRGHVQIDGDQVSADPLGEDMLTSTLFDGMSRLEAARALASGWSNGYLHTRVAAT